MTESSHTTTTLVGHRPIRALLARAVASGTVPHSLLFDGPDGVGKRTCALDLAAALNCLTRTDGWACGACSACTRMARGAHPDVIVLAPNDKGVIAVDMVRDVIASASYRPFEARRRVVVIDEADRMPPGAQNALLKTLEEPPPSSMIVLVTARPDALLDTVRSRCPRFRFGPLSTADVAEVLGRLRGMDEDAATALAAAAGGSVGRALVAEAGVAGEARAVALAVLQGVAGRPSASQRLGVAQRLVDTPKKKGGASERDLLLQRLEAMAGLLRDMGGVKAGAEAGVLASPDLAQPLASLAAHYDGVRLTRAFHCVDEARRALERNQAAKVVADWLACEL